MYKDHRGHILFGAFVGGAVATLATLLFTTKQGKKIQGKIVDAYENLEENIREGFSEAEEGARARDGAHTKAPHHLQKSKAKKENDSE